MVLSVTDTANGSHEGQSSTLKTFLDGHCVTATSPLTVDLVTFLINCLQKEYRGIYEQTSLTASVCVS